MKKDEEIMRCLRLGDNKIVERIYLLYYPVLYSYAESTIADKTAAENIAVNCIAQALEIKDRFKTMSDMKAFLYIYTDKECLRRLREYPLN